MRVVCLIENTEGTNGCSYAHGLSFYIETVKHKILMDLGPSGETLENAKKLGIDLGKIDTVILSHGHYDHSGGIIPFSKINDKAAIYIQKTAVGEFYSDDGDEYRYIGIDKEIPALHQVRFIEGDYVIDEELSLFVIDERSGAVPSTNFSLKEKKDDSYVQDDFRHEQFLVLKDNDRRIIFSGCAHNGVLNILKEYKRKTGAEPDAVISGFHLMKKTDYSDEELREIISTAEELKKYHAMFYTCHCTGIPAYQIMKNTMGDQLEYVHSGDEVTIKYRKAKKNRRNTYMKWHKIFAWATVVCFILTMITGIKRK